MGRKKKRSIAPRPKPVVPFAELSASGGDGDNASEAEESLLESSVSLVTQPELLGKDLDSSNYMAVKTECRKALTTLSKGNHTKALKLMKQACDRFGSSALIHRVQGTIWMKVASLVDDPNAKQKHLRNAIDSARKAVNLSPNSIEFSHFYASLLFEVANDSKEYKEVVQECERALAIKNPIDPAKERLEDENQQMITLVSADERVAHVYLELHSLIQKANIASTSTWRKTFGSESKEKLRSIPGDPMKLSLPPVTKTLEERRMEVQVKVAAARLLQKKSEWEAQRTNDEDKGNSDLIAAGGNQNVGTRRKHWSSRRNVNSAERKDQVKSYLNSVSHETKMDLLNVRVSDLRTHFSSSQYGPACGVLSEALSFAEVNKSWKFWLCPRCGEKFVDAESYRHHLVQEHVGSPTPKMRSVMPRAVENEWVDMLLGCSWKPLDLSASITMLENQAKSDDSVPYHLHHSWPLSDDIESANYLEKLDYVLGVLIRRNILAASHLQKVIKFTMDELQGMAPGSQFLKSGIEQTPLCMCFLGANQLRKILKFLRDVYMSSGVGKYPEKISSDDASSHSQVSDSKEKILLSEDASCLLLDENLLPSDTVRDNSHSAPAVVSLEKGVQSGSDSLLSWIYAGPLIGEQLATWFREEKAQRGVEILQMLERELSRLQNLCDKKNEHLGYEEAFQRLELHHPQGSKKMEHVHEISGGSYESVLRKRKDELIEIENEVMFVCNRFELEAITNVLKEAETLYGKQSGHEETYGSMTSHPSNLAAGEDDQKSKEFRPQVDNCIEAAIWRQKEQISTELSKIDGRIMWNVASMEQLEAELETVSAFDYRSMLLPLVKSFMRARLEDLAEKDAKEKSDAATLALLAELAFDSEKGSSGGNDNPKQLRGKMKDKRRNRDSRRTKARGYSEQLDTAERVSSTGSGGNIAYNEIAALGGGEKTQEALLIQRKIEEEKRLEVAKEYLRQFEDEPKQKHLVEKHKRNTQAVSDDMAEDPVDIFLQPGCSVGLQYKQQIKSAQDYHPMEAEQVGEAGSKTLRQQQAEDDEERFKADLEKAVCQSPASKIVQKVSQESDNLGSSSGEAIAEDVSGADVYGTGLQNEAGEYNCFLNVIIQSLWNLRQFREEFLRRSTSEHGHVGDPCVVCALYDILTALSIASAEGKGEAVAPTTLRIALSNLYPHSNFFKEGQMNDASEVLAVIFQCLHQSFTSDLGVSNIETVESNCLGSWDCNNSACIVHSLFGMDIFEQMNCYICGLESRHLKYTSFFHNVNASALREMKAVHAEKSFDELLNLVEMDQQLACDPEAGGCAKLNHIHHILTTPPHVFTTVLGWQNTCETIEDIRATLAALATEIDISVLYHGLDPQNIHQLVSVVCYCGLHYQCLAYSPDQDLWIMYDDAIVKVIGTWDDVLSKCEKGRWQPQVLFYEAVKYVLFGRIRHIFR